MYTYLYFLFDIMWLSPCKLFNSVRSVLLLVASFIRCEILSEAMQLDQFIHVEITDLLKLQYGVYNAIHATAL